MLRLCCVNKLTIVETTKLLLCGACCDNCCYCSRNDPICLFGGGRYLAKENICLDWKKE